MNQHLHDTFSEGISPQWEITRTGGSALLIKDARLFLCNLPTSATYANAQITDYRYSAFDFAWEPPVRLTVTASSGQPADQMIGTAGFGFWNHPFSPDSRRLPRLPRALWFFFSAPPNDMRLAHGAPGHGWKAATIDATRPRAWSLIPFAPPAALLMNIPPLYDALYPPIQRALGIAEQPLDPALMTERHTYTIDWQPASVTFAIDGSTVLHTSHSPRGKLGFVAWIDNQYAVVTPQGRFAFGRTPVTQAQSLILEEVHLEQLD